MRGVDTYYEIEWHVPAENAIGGKPYWHKIDDTRTEDWHKVCDLFAKCLEHYDPDEVRIVKITKSVVTHKVRV